MPCQPSLRALFPGLLLLFLGSACQLNGEGESAQAAPIQVLLEQQNAWNRGDLEAFVERGYWRSEGLRFYSGGSIRSGFDGLLDRYRQRYQSEGAEMGQLRFEDIEELRLSSEYSVVRGRWGLRFTDESTAGGLFTLLLQRFPEGWRIVHDHTSSAPD